MLRKMILYIFLGILRYDVGVDDAREIDRCAEEKLRMLLDYMKQIKYHVIETDKDIVELAGKFIDFGVLRENHNNDGRILGNIIPCAILK